MLAYFILLKPDINDWRILAGNPHGTPSSTFTTTDLKKRKKTLQCKLVYHGHSDIQTFISDESRVSNTHTPKVKPRGMGEATTYGALASAGRALARSTAAASVVGAWGVIVSGRSQEETRRTEWDAVVARIIQPVLVLSQPDNPAMKYLPIPTGRCTGVTIVQCKGAARGDYSQDSPMMMVRKVE